MLSRIHTQGNRRQLVPVAIFAAMLAAALLPAAFRGTPGPQAALTSTTTPRINMDSIPLQFEPNRGQSDPQARFVAHAPGGTFFFTPGGVSLTMSAHDAQPGKDMVAPVVGANAAPTGEQSMGAVTVQFVGSAAVPDMSGDTVLPGKVNYLIGNDPSGWLTDLPAYGQV